MISREARIENALANIETGIEFSRYWTEWASKYLKELENILLHPTLGDEVGPVRQENAAFRGTNPYTEHIVSHMQKEG